MTYEKQLDAAIAKKEEYLNWLIDVGILVEQSLERDLKIEMLNRFLINVGKVTIIFMCVVFYCLTIYAFFKYLWPYILPHVS